ncbi:hypothetical protein RvY_09344 [Ramazzottius varieornatus]|uniref:Protein sleepless n=1 Tax=Ramazzottius varieornatus TaxID=947166 RepID=A0A1D1V940_RAMVA|nr:hypothetical protein RvY_09344 [Ramazzottius varieornatus]
MKRTHLWVSLWVFICSGNTLLSRAETQHCYVCKSRGDRGDCKDPFNTDTGKSNIQPCFTGWCIKTTDTDENFPSTERTCMPNPPDDNIGRCTTATVGQVDFPKKVYTCYCKGNLCNASPRTTQFSSTSHLLSLFLSAVLLFLVR